MSLEGLQEAMHQTPFRPFKIRMASGKEYTVDHQDFISASRSYRRVYVSTQANDRVEMIDTLMIESVHYDGQERAAA